MAWRYGGILRLALTCLYHCLGVYGVTYIGDYPCPGGFRYNPARTASDYFRVPSSCQNDASWTQYVCPYKEFVESGTVDRVRGSQGCASPSPLGCDHIYKLWFRCSGWDTNFIQWNDYWYTMTTVPYTGFSTYYPFTYMAFGPVTFEISKTQQPNPTFAGLEHMCPSGIVGMTFQLGRAPYNALPPAEGLQFLKGCPICDTMCIPCNAGYYCPRSDLSKFFTPTICPVGTFCTEGAISPVNCPVGTFNGVSGQTACTQCSPGTYIATSGISACLNCEVGTFANGPGNVQCVSCPTGAYADRRGLAACAFCEVGTHGSAQGLSACTRCSTGTFAHTQGRSVCAECPTGTFASSQGVSACTLCALGTFANQTQRTVCTLCQIGWTTTAAGGSVCSVCAAPPPANARFVRLCEWLCNTGFFNRTSAGCTPCDDSSLCNWGFFRPPCVGGVSNTQTCSGQCVAGNESYTTAVWLSASSTNDASGCDWGCPSGTYKAASTQTCRCCAVDYMQPNQTLLDRQCSTYAKTWACAVGQYADGLCYNKHGVSTYYSAPRCADCTRIDNGRFTSQGTVPNAPESCEFTCNDGFFAVISNQRPCLPWTAQCPGTGYQWSAGTALSDAVCTPCTPVPNAFFTAFNTCAFACELGSELVSGSTCVACGVGKYRDTLTQTACLLCPSGTYTGNTKSIVCLTVPTNGLGTPLRDSFTCNAGYVKGFDVALKPACVICNAGYFAASNTACAACPAGKFNAQPAPITACLDCASGTYAGGTASVICSVCNAGFFAASTSGCAACPAGKFNPQPLPITACSNCASGMYAAGTGNIACIACSAGFYTVTSISCIGCSPGTFSASSGASACTACASGKFAAGYGWTECRVWTGQCPAGNAWNANGATQDATCTPCTYPATSIYVYEPNTCTYTCIDGYQVGAGCEACAVGKFKNGALTTYCTNCVPGTFQTGIASSMCTGCAPGTYGIGSGATGSSVCIRCNRGMFTSVPSSTVCLACSTGTYTTTFGSAACLPCAQGQTSGRGTTYCYPVGSKTAFYKLELSAACQSVSDVQFMACNM